MTNYKCKICGRHRKNDCMPEICLPGDQNKLYRDPKDDPKKFCYLCDKKLTRKRSVKYSPEYREIALECPEHGIIGYIYEQFKAAAV